MTVVVMMMVVLVMPAVMMMTMMVVESRNPDPAAVVVAGAPVMMAAPYPGNVVNHNRVGNSWLHRRRCNDRRARARRRQHCRGPSDRECSQCQ